MARLGHWLLLFSAGSLAVTALAPWNIWPAIIISQSVLAWRWWHNPAGAAASGMAYGTGLFGAGASWVYVSIHVHGHASPLLAGTLTGVFCLGLASLFAIQGRLFRYLISLQPLSLILVFPALWVGFEWLRSWLFTGFPWLYAGYATLESPFSGWAPVIGVFGASGLVATIAAGLVAASVATRQLPAYLIWGAGTGVLLIAGLALGYVEWTVAGERQLRVALYQPNIPLAAKWDRRNLPGIISQYRRNIANLDKAIDLIIWPESALPAYRHQIDWLLDEIDEKLATDQVALITGIPIRTPAARHNSIIGLGRASGEYHKQKLVPFGEYVPLEQWLRGLIAFFDLPMSQFSPGKPGQPLLEAGELKVAPLICYEVVYPGFVARSAGDADLLVTISNDSWFGDSIGPLQHLQMAQFRALETGRDLLRGTNNGVSAIVDHRGEITARLPQFEEGTLRGTVTPRQGATPYMKLGDYPTLLVALIALLIARFAPPKQRSIH